MTGRLVSRRSSILRRTIHVLAALAAIASCLAPGVVSGQMPVANGPLGASGATHFLEPRAVEILYEELKPIAVGLVRRKRPGEVRFSSTRAPSWRSQGVAVVSSFTLLVPPLKNPTTFVSPGRYGCRISRRGT